MHRTFSVPRLVGWWSLLIALALQVGIHAASAQNPLPALNAPGQSSNLQAQQIELAVGMSRACQMTTRADLKRVENPNSRVVKVERIPNKNNEILLVAESPGRTQVTLVDQNDRVEVHEVVVAQAVVQGAPKREGKRLIIVKGAQKTIVLDKVPLGGTQITISNVVKITPALDNSKIFTFEARAAGSTRVTFFADKEGKEVLAVYDIEVPFEDRITQLRDLIRKIAPAAAVEVHPLYTVTDLINKMGEKVKNESGDFIKDEHLAVLLRGTVNNANESGAIMAAALRLFPPSEIGQAAEPVGNGVAQITRLRENVINQMSIGGVHQVELHVVVAVVNRTQARNMSFSWNVNSNNFFLSSLVGGPGAAVNSLLTGTTGSASSLMGSGGNLPFGVLNNSNSIMGFLNLLRNEGLTKIIAEPRVVTLSGRSAKIVSGGKVDIVAAGGISSASISAEFGTIVNFLPVVLGNGKIHLEVSPEVSTPTNSIPIPGAGNAGTVSFSVLKRSAQVAVQLEDGQTLAIGGLIQNRIDSTTTKVPIFGDLPFIGAGFRSVSSTEIEEEMIILVTPRLVDGVDCTKIPKYLPGRETRNADDFELFLEGIMEAPRGQRNLVLHPYQAAYRNSPNAGQIPCNDGSCNIRGGAGCANGSCGTGNNPYAASPRNDNRTPIFAQPTTPTFPQVQGMPTSNNRIVVESEPNPMPPIREIPGTFGTQNQPNPMPPARQQDSRPVLPPITGR